MLKTILLLFSMIVFLSARTQDFSNKGKDFWIGYGNHVRMFENVTPQNPAEQMELYMTSDVNTSGAVEIKGIGFNQGFAVIANQITTLSIPRSAALLDEGTYNLGIHVTSDKPIVVYSFIYVNAISGATLCLPVSTLGREYYSINYTQVSNSNNSYSYFDVIATDTGTTTVEIIPAANTKGGHNAGVPFTVSLSQGQVYQALGVLLPGNTIFKGVDLTGTQIRSISTAATKCKKIAVFCGSGKISIGCNGSGTSDNLYQQMYPVSTWGKTYITVPSINKSSTQNQSNFYRIFKSDPAATVKLNGVVVSAANFVNSQYYEFNSTQPNYIEADKPIIVAQYLTTSGCSGNVGLGDPEMIYLNPVEQTISNVTLNSMQPAASTNINEHHLNVVLKNVPALINSFKVDGLAAGPFSVLASNPSYAYAQLTVNKGTHTLTCDSGFNAISYGFGNAESYGYSAGTNLKDLYQFVSIQNQYAVVTFPAGCKNSPFEFSMTFPYQPVKIKWFFKGLFTDTTLLNPVFDSTWVLNGRTLYRYTLNRPYIINNIGTFPITLVADNQTADGCSGEQEINYDLQIFEKPKAAFTISQTGCINDPINLLDTSNGSGRQLIRWQWNFGDGTQSMLKNPSHTYSKPGSYPIAFSSINDIGCLSDTAVKTVLFTEQPVAKFIIDGAACAKTAVKFSDKSTPAGGVKWNWDFGDGTSTSQQNPSHSYVNVGSYNVKLSIQTTTGCKDSIFQIVKVNYLPNPKFLLPAICLDDPFAAFTDSTTITDNSGGQFIYNWNFGDVNANVSNPNTSSLKNPSHKYTVVGNYDVYLQVTSKDGCSADTTEKFTVNGAVPKADFELQSAGNLCSNKNVVLVDRSTVDFGKITRLEIYWDYTNDPTTKTVDDSPGPGKLYTHKYADFGSPLTKNFQVMYVAYSGISCLHQKTATITIQASPVVKFAALPAVCQEVTALQVAAPKEAYGLTGTGIFSGSGISGSGTFNPTVAGAGQKLIRYTFTASNGCSSQDEATIQVDPTPLADAGPDRVVLEGGSVTIAAKASANCKYLWSPAVAIDNINILTPKVSPVSETKYQLRVESTAGCVAADEVLVTVLKNIEVPNVFSPNGDGINDTWKISYLASYPGASVEVYNRYGQLVFRSIGYSKEWNGEYNGSVLPMGTYYWIIDPKNGRPRMNGSVTLIR